MSMLKALCALSLAAGFGAVTAFAEVPGLGKPVSEADIAAWDISVMPDGSGLPKGSGTPAQGARIYAEKCSGCHGDNGRNPVLPGAGPMVSGPISGIDGPKTIGSFYGYSTIVFDFVRRAMPWNMPRTLTSDEVYAVTAYLLAINKIISEEDVMNAETLPKVKMPNRDNFIIRFPDRI
jgi:S-disulfanyl-L-cysteine oxidoreductase SoxD